MLLAPTLGWLAGPESSSAPELLREPPVLRNTSSIAGVVEVTITATPARIRLLPGGPLVNAAGQVIGINTAVAASGGTVTASNIGFAISIDHAMATVDQLLKENP